MKKSDTICDNRCHLFLQETIKNEATLRMKWFTKNQQKLLENLKISKSLQQPSASMTKEDKSLSCTLESRHKPQPPWRPSDSDGTTNIDIMRPIDPKVKALLYEDRIESFTAANNYFSRRYKESPGNRFHYPDCTSWIYGWRLEDFPLPLPSKVGRKSIIQAEFYQRVPSSIQQDPIWYRNCQAIYAKLCV